MGKYNKDVKVNPEEFNKLSKLLKQFERKEVRDLANNPQDINYALKLMEHLEQMTDYSGHLKWFQPGTPLGIEHYPRHKLFFDATKHYREVLFMAANRAGKSHAGALCISSWATGIYPDWWDGRVFKKETKCWVAADRGQSLKEGPQEALLGPPGGWGTGMLPKDSIVDVVIKPGTGGCVDTIIVKNEFNKRKPSRINTRTYEQGVQAFYAAAVDAIWEDEENTQLIHNECVLRTMTTNGIVISTFTPLHGLTPLVVDFMETADNLVEGL